MATYKESPKRIPRELTADEVKYFLSLKEEDFTSQFFFETFGTFENKPKYNPYDYFQVPANSYGPEGYKNKQPFTTGLGIFIFNKFYLEKDFTKIVGYINEVITKKKFNSMIINGEIKYALIEGDITTEQYNRLLQKTQFTMPLCTFLTPVYTEKFFETVEYLRKEKDKEFAANKKAIEAGDVVVIEGIEKRLIQKAKERNDCDPSGDIYNSCAKSSYANDYKNMYICKGAIRNPDPNAAKQYDIASSCYSSGISKEEYALFAKSLSAGPYKRACKTKLGGDWEKIIGAATQHIMVTQEDCKTRQGYKVHIDSSNIRTWMYSWAITKDGNEEINRATRKKYLNKDVLIMFPTSCACKDGYCKKCCGGLAYRMGIKAIGGAMEVLASKLKNISMKSFHDSTVVTHRIDPYRMFNYINQKQSSF